MVQPITPKVKMCGISKVETIPAVVEAKPDYMDWYLHRANDKLLLTKLKLLVEELHRGYAQKIWLRYRT